MTTEAAKKVLFLEGVVQGVEIGEKFTRLKVKRDKMNFPDTVTFWEKAQAQVLVGTGQRARVAYTESDNTSAGGKPYKDGVWAKAPGASPTSPLSAKATEEPIFPDEHPELPARAAPDKQDRPKEASKAPERGNGHMDSREASIEAQVALKAAVDLVQYILPPEESIKTKAEIVRQYVAEFTTLAAAAIREARGG